VPELFREGEIDTGRIENIQIYIDTYSIIALNRYNWLRTGL